MHVHVLCTYNGGGPDVGMVVGDSGADGGIVTNVDFTAEDAIRYGKMLIQEGEKALTLRKADREVQAADGSG